MNKRSCLLLSCLLVSGGMAQAHTTLKDSTPADAAALDSPPHEIVLNFSGATRLTAVSIRKEGESAKESLAPLPKEPVSRAALPLEHLAAGAYVVSWRAVGDDNHVVSGTLRFTVKGEH